MAWVIRAVTIQDRLGLEGSITNHYMTIDGVYIGTENKDQKLVMLPTNSETLQTIWKDADLTHPGGVSRPGPANALDAVPGKPSQADAFRQITAREIRNPKSEIRKKSE